MTHPQKCSPIEASEFKILFESMPGLFLVLSPDFVVLMASGGYLQTILMAREDILGCTLFELPPYNNDHARSSLKAALACVGESRKRHEMAAQRFTIVRPGAGSQEHYWNVSHVPVLGADGTIHYIIHHIEDATHIIKTNVELENSRGFLRNIINCVPDPIFVKDQQLRLIEGNDAMWELFGLPASELLGKTDYDYVPKDEADVFRKMDQEVFKTGKPNINIENFTDAAGVTHVISTKKACFNTADGEKILVGVIRDITELQLMQGKLRERDEARLKSIMDHSGRIAYIKDLEGRYLQINKEFLKVIGREEKDAIGKTNHDFFPKEYADKFKENDLQIIASSTASEFEQTMPQADGIHTHIVVKFPLYDADGKIYAICGIASDVTDKKRDELRLQQTMEELIESNIELERFAYICSHDLQEPLRMITSFTQRLVKNLDGKLDEKSQQYVKYIMDGATSARDLINDILIYSRIGTESEKAEPVDCRAVLSVVLKNLEVTSAECGVKITHDVLPMVLAHKTRVAQLLQNLLSNAIKFRRRDSEPKIHISVKREGDFWQFKVEDNGIGIDSEYHEKIFVLFQRLNKRGEYPGTGIGLAICKKIIESYQGRIWLESEPGAGTRFFFTLPVVTETGGNP